MTAEPVTPRHVVFGRVIAGRSVVRMIEDTPTKSDTPTERICIVDCGELGADEVVESGRQKDEFGDGFESHPSGACRHAFDEACGHH